MALNLMHSLLVEKLIEISNGSLLVTTKLLYMLDNEEMLTVEAPQCRVQMNGPIIDRLTCLE